MCMNNAGCALRTNAGGPAGFVIVEASMQQMINRSDHDYKPLKQNEDGAP